MKQSDGFVWVESAPGKGATFEIYLPQSTKSVMQADIEAAASTLPGGSETVLVVEDEAGVRELASTFLGEKGYRVLQASNGAEALEVAARHAGAIDLVLSDMVMPRMSGPEMAAELKKVRPDTNRICRIPGESHGGTRVRGAAGNCDHAETVFQAFAVAESSGDAFGHG